MRNFIRACVLNSVSIACLLAPSSAVFAKDGEIPADAPSKKLIQAIGKTKKPLVYASLVIAGVALPVPEDGKRPVVFQQVTDDVAVAVDAASHVVITYQVEDSDTVQVTQMFRSHESDFRVNGKVKDSSLTYSLADRVFLDQSDAAKKTREGSSSQDGKSLLAMISKVTGKAIDEKTAISESSTETFTESAYTAATTVLNEKHEEIAQILMSFSSQ